MSGTLIVLPDQDLSPMVFDHIIGLAEPLFERADGRRNRLASLEDVEAHQRAVREGFTELIGGLPERTPLNVRSMGSLERRGYRVEKIVFESRPLFYVTASLYLPERPGIAPAVLVPCGHAPDGKAHEPYQALAQALVRNGFVVLVYDPIGQGERSQYWDRVRRESRIGICTPEHDYAGTQALLVGRGFAAWRLWDAMRAVDVLCERDEVDVERIGCAGSSGGGTMTTYLFALDDRIRAAMPMCYITSREAWLNTGMLADAEQVQDGAIERGIDHADLLIAGAPRALRIGAVTRDFFPIEGTRRTFQEARRVYGLLGAADCVDLLEVEGEHGLCPPLIDAACEWFRHWLGRAGAKPEAVTAAPEPVQELWCCPGGLAGNLGSRTVFCFTRDEALTLPPAMPDFDDRGEAELWQDEMRGELRELLHCPASSGAPPLDQHGAFFRGSCGIERISFQSERGITVPGLLFVPGPQGRWPGILYVHEAGKEAEADPRGTVQMLAGEDNVVLAIDVRGVGETASADSISATHSLTGVDGYHAYQYGMLGHSLVGRRVHDVLRALAVLAERPEVDETQVSIVGQGMGGVLALFAAALDERVGTAVCSGGLVSYGSVAAHEYHAVHPSWLVSGILRVCDLPQVAACVAPRRLVLGGPVDHARRRVPQDEAEEAYAPAMAVYELFGASERFVIATSVS